MPIHQSKATHSLSQKHCEWLVSKYDNVKFHTVNLTSAFNQFDKTVTPACTTEQDANDTYKLACANSRARLRMMTLYQIAQCHNGLVVGTGNKVEDFGVGFFTKYGDGGVDLSPIGDCLKTEVWNMGRELGVIEEIINAAPTDGLWDDGRTDEDQLGMTYPELEHAMALHDADHCIYEPLALTKTEKTQLKKYRDLRARNMHKMTPIPVFKQA
jgi:NAD+ synthase